MEEGAAADNSHSNLVSLVTDMVVELLHGEGSSLLHRTRAAVSDGAPRLRLAARSASADIMRWMHQGGPWRAFLVTSVGIVIFVSLAALATFSLFFVTATVNTIAIAFLMSLSGIGAFMAAFFMMLSTIYIGTLIVAAFAISTIAFCTITAVVLATVWIGFFWLVWRGAAKFLELCRGSLQVTASTLSALSTAGSTTATTQVIAIEKLD